MKRANINLLSLFIYCKRLQVNPGMRSFLSILIIFILTGLQAFAQNCTVSVTPAPANVCPAGNIVLTASATGAATFNWAPTGTLSSGTGLSVTASPPATTTYTVTAVGCNGSTTVVVTMNTNPVAGFTFTPSSGCSSPATQFTSTSTPANGLTYAWNFGDGGSGANNTSTLPNPAHQFTAFGTGSQTFTISLTVTTPAGCKNTTTQTITLTKGPDASITDENVFTLFTNCQTGTGNPFTLVIDNSSTSQATNTNYDIDWGDATPHFSGAALPNGTSHLYNSLGYFTLTLKVDGSNGCNATKAYTVFNGSNPSVGLGSPGATVNLCGPVTLTFPFSNTSNNSPGTVYTVTFSDGGTQTFTHPPPASVTHTYTTSSCGHNSPNFSNSFYVKIQADNPCGSSVSTVEPIQVGSPPKADFTGSQFACVNQSVFFNNSSTNSNYIVNGNCTNTQTSVWTITPATNWTVTSGSITSNSFTAQFSQAGTYTVKLRSNNPCGSDSIVKTVCIVPPPISNYTFAAPGCAPATVNFTNTSNSIGACGNPTYNWAVSPLTGWNFANGKTAASTDASIQFNTAGTYTVTMTVTNPCGSDMKVQTFTIKSPPVVTLSSLGSICGAPVTIAPAATFGNGGGTISSYHWDFTGANPATSGSQTPGNVTYSTTGPYTITATATNECGTASDDTSFTLNAAPSANDGNDTAICNGTQAILNGVASGGITPYTYSWAPAGNIFSPSSASTFANPTATTTYTLTVTDKNGCTGVDQLIVTVNPLPTVNVSAAPTSICLGDSTTLTASGAASYAWSPSTGLSKTTGAIIKSSPSFFSFYNVTGTAANGCTANGNVSVTVNFAPFVSITPHNPTICFANNVTLDVTGANTYSWSPSTNLSATTGTSVLATPPATITYTVTGISVNGCTGLDSTIVTVTGLPIVTGSADSYTICIGQSTTLSASGATDYSWVPTTGLVVTTGNSIVAAPTVTTTYTVTGTSGVNCQDDDTVVVNVYPLPVVNVLPANPSICAGQSVTLTASGAATYTWGPNTALSATTGASVVANPPITFTYTLSFISVNGCVDSISVPITVHPLPVITVNPNPVSLCLNSSKTLSASGANTYTWKPNTAINQTTGANVSVNPMVNSTYSVTGTDNFGCMDSTFIPITVNPKVDGFTTQHNLCQGTFTSLIAANADTYTWSPATGLSGTTGPIVSAFPTTNTTYTVTGTTLAGCQTTDTVQIYVHPIPAVTVTPVSSSLCVTGTINYTAAGAVTYTWSPSTYLNATTGTNVIANPTGNIIYNVTGTDAYGCTNIAAATVSVSPIPTVNAGPDISVCMLPSPITLNSFTPQGGTWSGPGISTPTVASFDAVAAGPGAHKLYYSVINASVCTNMDSVTITVVAPVNASAGIDFSSCFNSPSFNLTGFIPAGGIWSGAGITNASLGTINPVLAGLGQHVLVYTPPISQCYNSDSLILTINPVPVASIIPGNASICSGQSVNLSATGGLSYTWSPAASLTASTGANVSANPVLTTTYTIIVTDVLGCTGTASGVVAINPVPAISINPVAPSICLGASGTLTANGASTYTWLPASGLSATTGTTVNANPTTTTTYTITGNDTNGCAGSQTVAVTVNTLPQVHVNPINSLICKNTPVSLSVSGANTYLWSPASSLSASTGSAVDATPVVTTTYTVTGTDANSCTGTDSSIVTINPLNVTFSNNFPAICRGASDMITASGATSYSWSPLTGLSSGTNSTVTVNPTISTTYTLIGTDAAGCTDSWNLPVTVHAPDLTITPDSASLCNGQSASITANGAVSYAWLPPTDLSSTTAGNVIANPAQSTTYTLIGTDQFNCTDTANLILTVFPQPVADFSYNPVNGCDPLTVAFTDVSSFPTKWSWTFSDGGSSDMQNPVHTFNGAGVYSASLSVTGAGNCNAMVSQADVITVYPEPIASFTYSQNTVPVLTGAISFSNLSENSDVWFWNFGDSTTSQEQNPIHEYANSGTYPVMLVSSNQFGCVDTTFQDVVVELFKGLFVPNAITPGYGEPATRIFTPKGFNLKNYHMQVFDTWGNLLWETSLLNDGHPAESWDGSYKGKLLQQDVYVWKCSATFLDNSVWKGMKYADGSRKPEGTITILR